MCRLFSTRIDFFTIRTFLNRTAPNRTESVRFGSVRKNVVLYAAMRPFHVFTVDWVSLFIGYLSLFDCIILNVRMYSLIFVHSLFYFGFLDKTPIEVKEYAKTFWERCIERILNQIKNCEAKILSQRSIKTTLDAKIACYRAPFCDLLIPN
jgi:hypothetical protein